MEELKKEPDNVTKVAKQIKDLAPLEVARDPRVEKQFIKNYEQIHGSTRGEMIYMAEKFHFGKIISDNPMLQKCSSLSLYGCIIDVGVQDLSLDPAKRMCYIVPMGGQAKLMISGVGELYLRQRAGQIKYADNPVVVYEGDIFKVGTTKDGAIEVDYQKIFPRKSEKIIASFIRITRSDGSIDFKVFSFEEIMDLKEFSPNKSSLAWGKGIRGMVEAKTIKHAFRNYPKAPLKVDSKFVIMETDVVEKDKEDIYGGEPVEEFVEHVDVTNEKTEPVTQVSQPAKPIEAKPIVKQEEELY